MKTARKCIAGLLMAALMMVSGASVATAQDYSSRSNGGTTIIHSENSGLRSYVHCGGTYTRSLSDARRSYRSHCGEAWNPNSGYHVCHWSSRGWRCMRNPG